jgi:hypothetical protein
MSGHEVPFLLAAVLVLPLMLCEACSGADIRKVWQAQQKRRRQIGMIKAGETLTPTKSVPGRPHSLLYSTMGLS